MSIFKRIPARRVIWLAAFVLATLARALATSQLDENNVVHDSVSFPISLVLHAGAVIFFAVDAWRSWRT